MGKIKRFKCFFRSGALIICIVILLTFPYSTMAAPKGKLRYAQSGALGMNGFDIHTATGAWHSTPTSIIHGKLVIRDSKGHFIPSIAKSWEIGPSFSFAKFYLNENAKFHDGQPVTAEDIKFTFERGAKAPKYVWRGELNRHVDRVEVVNKHTVIIHNKSAYTALLDRCAGYYGILPKHYLEKVGGEEFAKKPIGAGPFKLVEYKQDVSMDAEAFTEHHRKVPNIKHLRIDWVKEDATRTAMLKTGEIDMAILGPTFWELEGRDDIRIVWSKNSYMATLGFLDLAFEEPSPLKDARVRRAVSLAIDRKQVAEKVMHNMVSAWGDIYPPYTIGFDPDLKPDPFDPEQAKALLKEAGYPNGFETTLYARPAQELETQAIAASLAKAGIKAKLNVPESGMYSRMIREKKMRGLGTMPGPWWGGRSHPALAVGPHLSSANQWTYYATPKVDEMLTALEKMTDPKEIEVQARALSKFYREEYVRAPLWGIHTPYGVRKRVKYWEMVPGRVFARLFEYAELAD